MKLSIVTTLYQSAEYLQEFYDRCTKVAQYLVDADYEIIFVNDGSPDKSLEIVVELAEQDKRVVVVDLSRNFGHHKAMMTGLAYASGERVFLVDSDLEEDPELLLAFDKSMTHERCDVVYGVQEKRKGGWFERISGQLFYSLFRKVAGMNLPENVVTARLMTADYVKALISHKERELFIAGLWYLTGFKQIPYPVLKHASSETTYTFRRKLSIFVNSITSFSSLPLVSIFYVGATISLFASMYIVYLCVNWLFLAKPISGWTSIMASIWLLGGMIILFLGVIGVYLSKVFLEVKQRPYTLVRKIYGKNT